MSTAPAATGQSYRFVWRPATAKRRWYSKTFDAMATPADAILALHDHLVSKLGKPLADVVVDHYFYVVTPVLDSDRPMWTSEPVSLRDFKHEFWVEYNNKVHSPGSALA